jgi:hypothetical protein
MAKFKSRATTLSLRANEAGTVVAPNEDATYWGACVSSVRGSVAVVAVAVVVVVVVGGGSCCC